MNTHNETSVTIGEIPVGFPEDLARHGWTGATRMTDENGMTITSHESIATNTGNQPGLVSLIEVPGADSPDAATEANESLRYITNNADVQRVMTSEGNLDDKVLVAQRVMKVALSSLHNYDRHAKPVVAISMFGTHNGQPVVVSANYDTRQCVYTKGKQPVVYANDSFKVAEYGFAEYSIQAVEAGMRIALGSANAWKHEDGSEVTDEQLQPVLARPNLTTAVESWQLDTEISKPNAVIITEFNPTPRPSKLSAAPVPTFDIEAIKNNDVQSRIDSVGRPEAEKSRRAQVIAGAVGTVVVAGAGVKYLGHKIGSSFKNRTKRSKNNSDAATLNVVTVPQAQNSRPSSANLTPVVVPQAEQAKGKKNVIGWLGAGALLAAAVTYTVVTKDLMPGVHNPLDFIHNPFSGLFGSGSSKGGRAGVSGNTNPNALQYDEPIGPKITESNVDPSDLTLSSDVNVEKNSGYTYEIQDSFQQQGISISPEQSSDAYQHLNDTLPELKGQYFTSIPAYSEHGEYLVQNPGSTTWDPRVIDELQRWYEESKDAKKK